MCSPPISSERDVTCSPPIRGAEWLKAKEGCGQGHTRCLQNPHEDFVKSTRENREIHTRIFISPRENAVGLSARMNYQVRTDENSILYILYYISLDDIPCSAFEGRSCFLPAILCRRWSYPTKLKRFSPIILRRLMRA